MIRLHLWKCLSKKESFELGFEVREGWEIPQAGWQRIPDSWSNETERTVIFVESSPETLACEEKNHQHREEKPREVRTHDTPLHTKLWGSPMTCSGRPASPTPPDRRSDRDRPQVYDRRRRKCLNGMGRVADGIKRGWDFGVDGGRGKKTKFHRQVIKKKKVLYKPENKDRF